MKLEQMKIGVWIYGLATVITGILDVVWREFEASHQPIRSLGPHIPGEAMLATVAGVWLVAAGIAILWRRTFLAGAVGSAMIYLVFALFWVPRLFAIIHVYGLKVGTIAFGLGGIGAELLLAAPALIVYAATATTDLAWRERALIVARWMLGVPPILIGLGHLINFRAYAGFVPHWVAFSVFWVVFTGIAFLLAGSAIVAGIQDVLAARMLALMLFLFEFMVELPPVFSQPQKQGAWGGAVYNITAIGACWMFAEFVQNRRRADQREVTCAENHFVGDRRVVTI